MKASLKKAYLEGRLSTPKIGSPKPYRRDAASVKSLDSRVLGAVTLPDSKSA